MNGHKTENHRTLTSPPSRAGFNYHVHISSSHKASTDDTAALTVLATAAGMEFGSHKRNQLTAAPTASQSTAVASRCFNDSGFVVIGAVGAAGAGATDLGAAAPVLLCCCTTIPNNVRRSSYAPNTCKAS